MQKLAGCTVTVQHQDRVVQKIFKRKGLMLQFPIVFPAGDEAVLEILDKTDVGAVSQTGIGIVGEGVQIHSTALQQVHTHPMEVWLVTLIWMFGYSLWKRLRYGTRKIPADGITGADTELSSAERTGLHNLHLSAFDEIHGRFNVTQKNLPLRCQLYLFCAADEKGLVRVSLSSTLMDWLTADWEIKSFRDASEKLKEIAT